MKSPQRLLRNSSSATLVRPAIRLYSALVAGFNVLCHCLRSQFFSRIRSRTSLEMKALSSTARGMLVDVPYAVVYALRDLAYCYFELDRAAYRCDRTDVGGEVIRESGPRHRVACSGFLVFWCRLPKLQQHRVVIGRELVENGQLMELYDTLHHHYVQDVGLSVMREYRGLGGGVHQQVEFVGEAA
ncbi:hypothetical protein Trydic_g9501 [Trypoxylus dichotomus]